MYLLRHTDSSDLFKSHIRQYMKKDGTVVTEHDDKRIRKHVDVMHHENAHGEEIHEGSRLQHGSALIDHLSSKGWKNRDVAAVQRDATKPKTGAVPEPPTIPGKNQENTALVSAQRIINRMHDTAKDASRDPSDALIAMTTSRANPYLKAVDDYRSQLLAHFGHKVDPGSTHQKFEKDGHTLILAKDGDQHRVAFAGGDVEDQKQVESVHGKQAKETIDTGKKDPKFVMGDDNVSYTGKMNKIASKYALVEMGDLTTSHNHDGHMNAAYPQEIQPRDRARIASRLQIQDIANNIKPELLGVSHLTSDGAPIVGPDGVVESGNGRTIALGLAYKIGKGDEYKGWLKDYAKHAGLNPADVAKMQHPVLVRVRQTEVDRPEFAREANQSNLMQSSPVEVAFSDAERISDAMMAKYQPDEFGDVLNEENQSFIQDFLKTLGKNETAGMMDEYGEPNKRLVDRVQAAVFAKVYKSEVLTKLMAESADSDVRNIINAMSAAAGGYAKIQQHSDLDVTHELLDSIDHIRSAKRNKSSIDNQLAQASFDADGKIAHVDPVTEELTRAVHEYRGSRRKLTTFFKLLTEKANKEIADRADADQYGATDMFGNAAETKGKGAIVHETAKEMKETGDVRKSHPDASTDRQARHDRRSAQEDRWRQGRQKRQEKDALNKSHVHEYDRTTASGAMVHVQAHDDSRVRQYGQKLAAANTQIDLHKLRQGRFLHLPHWGKLDEATRDHILTAEQEKYQSLKNRDEKSDSRAATVREKIKARMQAGGHVSRMALLATGLAERTSAGTQLVMFKAKGTTGMLYLIKGHVKAYSRTTANGTMVQVREHDDNRPVGPLDVLANGTKVIAAGKKGVVTSSKTVQAHPSGSIVVHKVKITHKSKVIAGGKKKWTPIEKPETWEGNYSFLSVDNSKESTDKTPVNLLAGKTVLAKDAGGGKQAWMGNTVGVASLHDKKGNCIGYCYDTPNAIASAMKHSGAHTAIDGFGDPYLPSQDRLAAGGWMDVGRSGYTPANKK